MRLTLLTRFLLIFFLLEFCIAQQQQVIIQSGGSVSFPNSSNATSISVQETIAGNPTNPSTSTIVVSGINVANTLDILDTYSGNVSTTRTVTSTKTYVGFRVQAYWQGGIGVGVSINITAIGNPPNSPFQYLVTLGPPSGSCITNALAKDSSTGNLYDCGPAGMWLFVGPTIGNGGSGVVSSGTSGQTGCFTATGTTIVGCTGAINASAQPGATVVQQVNYALGLGNQVFIPAGTYNINGCSGWTLNSGNDPVGPFYFGSLLTSGQTVYGAGMGSTIINVTRLSSDPYCALFGNATRTGTGNNPNITLHDMTINWTDQGSSSAAFLEFVGADRLTMYNMELTGNPNHILSLLDTTRVNIHDNRFLLNTTSGMLGNAAISSARFQSGVAYLMSAGSIDHNYFAETGNVTYGMSMVVLTQSNLEFAANTIDLTNYCSTCSTPSGYGSNSMETGEDNDNMNPSGLMIVDNHFIGGVIRLALNDSVFAHNYVQNGPGVAIVYPAAPSGNGSGRLKVQGNTIDCQPDSGEGCELGVNNTTGAAFESITITDNVIQGGVLIIGGSSGGDCVIENNKILNSTVQSISGTGLGALEATNCSTIRGNTVKNFGADGVTNGLYGIYIMGTNIVDDVSNNTVIDNQTLYSTGNVCSVANTLSTTCLASGSSTWLYSAGATWSTNWSNRYIFISSVAHAIRDIYSANYIELENPILITSATAYSLTWSFDYGYYLGSNILNFSNNHGILNTGGGYSGSGSNYSKNYPNGGWITDVSGNYILEMQGNTFTPLRNTTPQAGACSDLANCNYNYNQSQTLFTSASDCSSGATPAVCGASTTGAVAVPTGTNPTLVIDTTAVKATSRIYLTIDESLTISGITCNTSLATLVEPVVTARTPGTSFTIQISATLATNPACVSYEIVN